MLITRETYNKGQSLFEVVVALAISALVIVGIVALVSTSIRNSTYSKNKTIASRYAQETTEWLRQERDNNIADFLTKAQTPIWCLSSHEWIETAACAVGQVIPNTIFTREVHFDVTSTLEKTAVQATVAIYWDDSQGQHQINNVTSFSDWRQRE